MTTYFHKAKPIMAAFSLLLLMMIASFTTNAASKERQTTAKFAPVLAALAHPAAAVGHHRNAQARRHNVENQPTATPNNTTPK